MEAYAKLSSDTNELCEKIWPFINNLKMVRV